MSLLVMVLMGLMTAAGQVLVKKGLNQQAARGLSLGQIRFYLNPRFFLGGALVLTAPFLYLEVLSRLGLAAAFPLNGLSYPLVYALGILCLGEKGNRRQTAGVLVIFAGITLWSI